jgi:hypothetical protein
MRLALHLVAECCELIYVRLVKLDSPPVDGNRDHARPSQAQGSQLQLPQGLPLNRPWTIPKKRGAHSLRGYPRFLGLAVYDRLRSSMIT